MDDTGNFEVLASLGRRSSSDVCFPADDEAYLRTDTCDSEAFPGHGCVVRSSRKLPSKKYGQGLVCEGDE